MKLTENNEIKKALQTYQKYSSKYGSTLFNPFKEDFHAKLIYLIDKQKGMHQVEIWQFFNQLRPDEEIKQDKNKDYWRDRRTPNKTTIKKHIHAYLFRHSRASYLASQGLNEAQMCMIFGWTIGSKQPATYIHLSGAQVENAYKQLYGLKHEEKTHETMIKCEVCGEINPSKLDTCQNCYNPLTIQGALKIKQEKDLMKQDRDISQKVFAQAVKIMSEKGISVEDAQKEAIQIVAAQQIQGQKDNG